MGDPRMLEARLAEWEAEAQRTGKASVEWYPRDLLEQLRAPGMFDRLEEFEHHPDRPDPIDYPLKSRGQDSVYFYQPGELTYTEEVGDLVRSKVRDCCRMDIPERFGLGGVRTISVAHDDLPALASEVEEEIDQNFAPRYRSLPPEPAAQGDASAAADRRVRVNRSGPNHLVKGGPVDCGGPGDNPDNSRLGSIDPPRGEAGRGVRVAVLDSGILPAQYLPDWLTSNIVFDDPDDVEDDYFDVIGGREVIQYPRVHGTFVAAILRRQAPGATIIVQRVLDQSGSATEEHLGRKLAEVVLRYRPHIVNLSLGCYSYNGNLTPHLEAAWDLLQSVEDPKIVVVAAAGNKGLPMEFWPASLPDDNVVGVGAVNRRGKKALFSNEGPPVKVWALGEGVKSVYATGVFAREHFSPPIANRRFKGVARWGGTSFAAPLVSGLIAAAMTEDGGRTAVEAKDHVLATAANTTAMDLPMGHDGRPVPLVTSGVTLPS